MIDIVKIVLAIIALSLFLLAIRVGNLERDRDLYIRGCMDAHALPLTLCLEYADALYPTDWW